MKVEHQSTSDQVRFQALYGYPPAAAAAAVGRLESEARFYANWLGIDVGTVRERMSVLLRDTERVADLRGAPPVLSVEAVVTTRTYRELLAERPPPPSIPTLRRDRDDPRVKSLMPPDRSGVV